jgi:hypothetical protein
MWKEILQRLYLKQLITSQVLDGCVAEGLISDEEKQQILDG